MALCEIMNVENDKLYDSDGSVVSNFVRKKALISDSLICHKFIFYL